MTTPVGPDGMRQLLDAVVSVGSDLDLLSMLRRIVHSAVDLVDAMVRSGLDEQGVRLAQVSVGRVLGSSWSGTNDPSRDRGWCSRVRS